MIQFWITRYLRVLEMFFVERCCKTCFLIPRLSAAELKGYL
ncbi:hypothetical protein GARC_4064 [Paraglaciecola arctica BSs20135]|uniref:Uncharacterized protein n=1 Tax=Paraglaciecola arctica BSs20135 TaxID=493475 RepID=K6YAN1_9ALTE|nr:hypothetical protein GARC_4064 [Paraglaciecola arctica BSs20135]